MSVTRVREKGGGVGMFTVKLFTVIRARILQICPL